MSVRIMTVCTGNICRSPYAHHALAVALEAVRPGVFEVDSAGTHAMVGDPVDPASARILDPRGIAHDGFAARQLSSELLDGVDVVLPMTVKHRGSVVQQSPRHLTRAYTLKELARLLDSAGESEPWTQRLAGLASPEERWRQLPRHLARERGLSRVPEDTDDLDDPYKEPQAAFEAMAREVDAAIERIVAFERLFD